MQCQNKQKQIALGLHGYHDAIGALPPGQPQGYFYSGWSGDPQVRDLDRSSWAAFVLPFIEQDALHNQFRTFMLNPTTHTCFTPFAAVPLQAFMCPSDPNAGKISSVPGNAQGFHTNYVLCHGSSFSTPATSPNGANLDGLFFARSAVKFTDIGDGTSNTVMVSELLLSRDTTEVPQEKWTVG
jgi:hypothetical protein